MDPTYFTSMGSEGVCVALGRALAVQRKVWMSEAFQEAHTSIAAILKQAERLEGSRWSLIQNKGPKCFGLVTVAEKRDEQDSASCGFQ